MFTFRNLKNNEIQNIPQQLNIFSFLTRPGTRCCVFSTTSNQFGPFDRKNVTKEKMFKVKLDLSNKINILFHKIEVFCEHFLKNNVINFVFCFLSRKLLVNLVVQKRCRYFEFLR